MKKRRDFLVDSGVFIATGVFASGALTSALANEPMKMGKEKKMKAMDFRAVSPKKATIKQSGEEKMFCPVCGMTLPMFYRTNHTATMNGEIHQYCSIHCMHEEASVIAKAKPVNPEVVDNSSLKFIDANKAFYVVGSNKPATMSTVSKYAFANKAEAEKFAKANGGEIMGYTKVSDLVSNSLEATIKMIRKRQKKAAIRGEKIFSKFCKNEKLTFQSPAKAKAYLQKSQVCGDLKGKDLQHVGLFLSGR